MATEPEKKDEGSLDERLTWQEGDFTFIGPDGKPVDTKKLLAELDGGELPEGPTLHLFLPEEE